jgi:glycosyltransferase involved in cell wall biosynthesis
MCHEVPVYNPAGPERRISGWSTEVRILITSGIWPPAVGGPASHVPELGSFLVQSGHEVEAVTTADRGQVDPSPFPVKALRRDRALALRLSAAGVSIASASRGKDVLYSAGLYTRSALAARLNSVPLVIKLACDPAFERARSRGLFAGSLDDFQKPQRDVSISYLKWQRNATMRTASRVIIPSRYLARLSLAWGLRPERVKVIPNPVPDFDRSEPRGEVRRRLGIDRPIFVFAGRFVAQKNLPLAIAALRHSDDATLVILGDGPEATSVAAAAARSGLRDRISVKGAVARATVVEWIRAADAAVLPSDWENYPHAAVEALAAGTPVIATAVGGVPEIVQSGVNGLLVPQGDDRALGAAMASMARDTELARKLRAGAEATAVYAADWVHRAIERELEDAALPR